MPVVERFEDLTAWQKSRELTRVIYRLSSQGDWAKDYGLRDQIRRASVSVMSNIAEGFERRGGADFGRFLDIPKGLPERFDASYMWHWTWAISTMRHSARLAPGLRKSRA